MIDLARSSVEARQDLLQTVEEFRPAVSGALVSPCLVRREAGLLHAQMRAGAGGRQRPGHHAVEALCGPCVGQHLLRFDAHDLALDGAPVGTEIKAMAERWLEV